MLYSVITTFNIILIYSFVEAAEPNMTKLFELYKTRYHRIYRSEKNELEGFNNFKINMNKVAELNAHVPGHHTYVLNRYADLNPDEISDHFKVNIQPYDNVINGTYEMKKRFKRQKVLKDMKLYDLNEVEDLYKSWVGKWGRVNFTKQFDQIKRNSSFMNSVALLKEKLAMGPGDAR